MIGILQMCTPYLHGLFVNYKVNLYAIFLENLNQNVFFGKVQQKSGSQFVNILLWAHRGQYGNIYRSLAYCIEKYYLKQHLKLMEKSSLSRCLISAGIVGFLSWQFIYLYVFNFLPETEITSTVTTRHLLVMM